MHHEACETSWRSAGFRTINQTEYLGCIPNEDHSSWDPEQDDPEFVPETKPSKQQSHERALLKAISAGDSGTLARLLCHTFRQSRVCPAQQLPCVAVLRSSSLQIGPITFAELNTFLYNSCFMLTSSQPLMPDHSNSLTSLAELTAPLHSK